MSITENNMTTTNTAAASNIVKVSEIGMAFGKEYYTVLSREPSRLHLFYAKNSTLLHAQEGDLDTPIVVGSDAIQLAVNKSAFGGSRFIIQSIDCHPSLNGGILVNVLGEIHNRSSTTLTAAVKPFIQTFFLAEQPSGYFILNDNLRFLDDKSTVGAAVSATPAAAPLTSVAAAPSAVSAEPIAPTVAAVEACAAGGADAGTGAKSPETKVKKVTTKKSAAATTPKSKEAEAPAAVTPAAPSSWAQLAAVQQSKWATGVVAPAKGTSITNEPMTEKPLKKQPQGDSRDSRDARDSRDSRDARDSRDSRDTRDSKNPRDTRDSKNPRDARDSRDSNKDSKDKAKAAATNVPANGVPPKQLPFVPEASLYVTGVTDALSVDQIKSEFSALGPLAHFDVKRSSGAAFIEYADPTIAKILLEQGTISIAGVKLTVEKRRVASRNAATASSAGSFRDSSSKKFNGKKNNNTPMTA